MVFFAQKDKTKKYINQKDETKMNFKIKLADFCNVTASISRCSYVFKNQSGNFPFYYHNRTHYFYYFYHYIIYWALISI